MRKIFTKKNLPMIIAVAVIVVAVVGGVLVYVAGGDDAPENQSTHSQSQTAPVPDNEPSDEATEDGSDDSADDPEDTTGSHLPATDRDATKSDIPKDFPVMDGMEPRGYADSDTETIITFTVPNSKDAVDFYKDKFDNGDYYIISQNINRESGDAAKWLLQSDYLPPDSRVRIYEDGTMYLSVAKEK